MAVPFTKIRALTDPDEPQRVKVLRVSAQALLDMLKGFDGTLERGVITCHGLPADAKAVGLMLRHDYNEFGVIVESAEFPEVMGGWAMEWMEVTFSATYSPRFAEVLEEVRAELAEDHATVREVAA